MAPADYQRFCQALERVSGIQLGAGKSYLVTSRLTRLVASFGLSSVNELATRMVNGHDAKLVASVVDAMTTNETKWFRDNYPFKAMNDIVLPEWVAANKFSARILSAACSTGQEAYSISMIVSEFEQRRRDARVPKVQIVGTDLADTVLDQARKARYDDKELARGLDPDRRRRYFTQCGPTESQLAPEIANRASFQKRNLLDNFTSLGRFDIVFCRNVLIYFANDLKQKVLANCHAALNSQGYLVVGGSESLGPMGEHFRMISIGGGVIYQRKD